MKMLSTITFGELANGRTVKPLPKHEKVNEVRMRKLQQSVAVLGLVMCGTVTQAHHSTAEFDYGKNVTIQGTVVENQWMNPHCFVEVLVPGSGGPETAQRWSIEYGSPNINTRMGWKRSTLKVGDKVTMHIAPTRDGMPRGTLRSVTLPNGQEIKGIAGLAVADKDGGAPLIDTKSGAAGGAYGHGDKK